MSLTALWVRKRYSAREAVGVAGIAVGCCQGYAPPSVLCETKASAPERVALGLTATLVHARAELNVRRSVPTTSLVR